MENMNKNTETEKDILNTEEAGKPEQTSMDVTEEILEQTAAALPQQPEATQKAETAAPAEEAKEQQNSFEANAQDSNKQPPKIPAASRVSTPWTRNKVSFTVSFALAALFGLGAVISGIFTAVQPVQERMMSLKEYNDTYEFPDFDSDFFDREFEFDFNDGYQGSSWNSSSMQPMSRRSTDSPVSAGKDWTPTFGFAICGSLFACTGLILLNKEKQQ